MRYRIVSTGNVIVADSFFMDQHHANDYEVISDELIAAKARRLSKLAFVGRLGDDFRNVLIAAKTSVDIEMFVRMLDWATPDPDGTSVDLDDPRVIHALTTMETAGVIGAGKTAEVLA